MTSRHMHAFAFFAGLTLTLYSQLALSASEQFKPHEPDMSDMVLIPSGEFIMGSDRVEKENVSGEFGNVKPWYLDEHPLHKVTLPAYYIEEHEVTNGQYLRFQTETGANMPEDWPRNGYILRRHSAKLQNVDIDRIRKLATDVFHIDKNTLAMTKDELLQDIDAALIYMDSLPVTYVSWQQANSYCQWAGMRLPTEEEWEKAARGTNGQEFPWGNEWHSNMTNTGSEQWEMHVAPVESYSTDKSPFGIYDLAGNVSEWVADWYHGYQGTDFNSQNYGEKFKVVRGAGWSGGEGHYALQLFQRGAYRGNLPPNGAFDDVGFRCAADNPPTTHAMQTNH